MNIERIIDIAHRAGDIVMGFYRKNPSSKIKSDKTIVTEADFAADRYIRSELHRLFPDDKILSEETESDITDFMGRVWIVDPLDGTRYFSEGREGFCNIIGLCQDGVPVLGVIYDPVNVLTYYAENGSAFQISEHGIKTLRASNKRNLADALTILKPADTNMRPKGIIPVTCDVSAALKVMTIARGEYDLHIDAVYLASKWDVCGTQAILEAAGGKLTDLRGEPINYLSAQSRLEHSSMASNGLLHEKVVKELRRVIK